MPRPWTVFLTAAALFWGMRVSNWLNYGVAYPLTVGNALERIGLPLSPPGTALGEVWRNILETDGGFFCLLLGVASLVVEASLRPRNR